MKNLLFLLLCIALTAHTLNAQCGLNGPGTNGATVKCGQTATYYSSCNLSGFYRWSIGGAIDIDQNSSLPLTFQTGDVGGTVIYANTTSIRINWDCATTSCKAMTTIEHNGTEFFNPIIRIKGENCAPACVELPTALRYKIKKGGTIQFFSNCGYCVTFSIIVNGVVYHNQQLEVIPQGTDVTYSGMKIQIFNVQYHADCPKKNNNNIGKVTYGTQKRTGTFDGGVHLWTLKVYPNPASNTATIQLPELTTPAQLEIYNNIGHVLYSKSITNTTEMELNIDLNQWPKGLYVVSLRNDSTTKQVKLLVQ